MVKTIKPIWKQKMCSITAQVCCVLVEVEYGLKISSVIRIHCYLWGMQVVIQSLLN